MQKWTVHFVCSVLLGLASFIPASLHAQAAGAGKPPVYLYIAEWSVPRAQWGDMVKADEQDKPVLDKLIADGTLVGYGAYTNLLHREGGPTHGTWMTATSEGKILKALEAIYAQPGLVTAPVQAASKHSDLLMVSDVYNSKSGSTTSGYLTYSRWETKPGSGRSFHELAKKTLAPVLEKLLAEGTITSYGLLNEDYHSEKMGVFYDYFTVPDAASLDKASQALDEMLASTPALGDAMRSMTDSDGHRDFLTRLRFMVAK